MWLARGQARHGGRWGLHGDTSLLLALGSPATCCPCISSCVSCRNRGWQWGVSSCVFFGRELRHGPRNFLPNLWCQLLCWDFVQFLGCPTLPLDIALLPPASLPPPALAVGLQGALSTGHRGLRGLVRIGGAGVPQEGGHSAEFWWGRTILRLCQPSRESSAGCQGPGLWVCGGGCCSGEPTLARGSGLAAAVGQGGCWHPNVLPVCCRLPGAHGPLWEGVGAATGCGSVWGPA